MNFSIMCLSFIVASRFFSLFIVLPVISLYAHELEGASTITVGLIVGIYAIFQMLFSLPFGFLSDLIGRKNSMWLGLLIFIAGSLISANAHDIYTMLLGRSLQGAGAIGGVATAMIADLTSEQARGKAMAIMGASIGMSFAAAMIIGPALAHFAGLASLFYVSAGLSVLAALLLFALPAEQRANFSKSLSTKDLRSIITRKNLVILYLTNLFQKFIAAAVFMIIPISFVKGFSQEQSDLFKLYASAMALGFLAMGAGGVIGESKGKSKLILLLGVVLLGSACALFSAGKFALFLTAVGLFFIGFCLHEPIMQSSLSKICPIRLKGSVLGLANACGYLGSFLGPICCALAMHKGFLAPFLLILCALCVLWFLLLLRLENPNDFRRIHVGFGANISKLVIADRGCDERGEWVKINLKKYPLSYIAEQLGMPLSGASEFEFIQREKKEES